MKVHLKPLDEQVVVITGATSGIGRQSAVRFGQAGAKVVCVARNAEALADVVREITSAGGTAASAVADVGERDQLQAAADFAVNEFGRIDTWVNNAGVGIWGRIEEVSEQDMRRLFDTNFWGEVNGSLVAIPHLKQQGGALINVGSLASDRAIPLQGIYSASKHAVKGFTDALRMELEEAGAPISVTLIKPSAIGSPLPQHVKNYTGQEARLPPPVYAPEEAAEAILYAAQHSQRDVFVGSMAAVTSVASRVAPRTLDWASEAMLFKAQLGKNGPTPTDNLHAGRAEGKVRGDLPGTMVRPSLYTRANTHPLLAGAALAGLALVTLGRAATRGR